MNAVLVPEVLKLREDTQQSALPLSTAGVQRYVWEGRFGAMLIEVVDGVIYVNGDRIDRIRDMPDTSAAALPTGDHS